MVVHVRDQPRHATPSDLDSLLALEQRTFTGDRISRRQWRRHLASTSASVLVAGPPGDVSAAAVVFYRANSPGARLYSLAVREDSRRAGLGGTLLAAAEADARGRGRMAMRLEVGVDNRSAIALYERCGYHRLARLPAFYEDGADAWRYAKRLTTVTR
ncbi:MAG TPA: N-acetyltransferase [Rhodanobacteraceae bacterium]|jgi:ribosomal protein S18 acetylase RimI-like enzyme|nr:N-acetyltransferase [Rhodanobacteraceae bacterium]